MTTPTTVQEQRHKIVQTRRSDRQKWSDLYHLWHGRHGLVMDDYFQTHYKDASDSGDLVPRHTRLLRWAAVNTAPSSTWEPTVRGSDAALEVMAESVKAIQTALAISELAGMLWLELRTRRGKPYLRATWGHSFSEQTPFVVDPAAPESLADCLQISLDTPQGAIVYKRSVPGGPVTAYLDGEVFPGYPTLPIMPIMGIYRDGEVDSPLPGMDEVWLSAQKGLTETVTDAAFHSRSLPGIRIIEGQSKDDTQVGEMPMNPNSWFPLPDGAHANQLNQPSGAIREMLSTAIDTVRLTAVLANLPPDLVEQMGRSETGAARNVDMAAYYRRETADWKRASKVYAQIQRFLSILLPAFGVDVSGLAIELPKPEQPETGDPLHIEQARALRIKNGVSSRVDEIMRAWGYSTREQALEKLAQIDRDQEAFGVQNGSGSQGDAAEAGEDRDVDSDDPDDSDPLGDQGT